MIEVIKVDFVKITEKQKKDWNIVLENSNAATIFHTPEWIQMIDSYIPAKCELFIAYHNDQPVGVFPYYIKKGKMFSKKATTAAFETPYGGPIIIEDSNEDIIVELLRKQEESLVLVKSKIILPPNSDTKPYQFQKFKSFENSAIVLNLAPSEDELFSQLHKMKKRNIKKAKNNNVEIFDDANKYLQDFHLMLQDTYKRLELLPPKPIEFYQRLLEILIPLNRVRLLVAFYEGKAIASGIYLLYKKNIIFWQGAAYREYMKLGPNDLVHWDIIKYGKANGFEKYNLLHFHDNKGVELESLKKFKQGFGGVPTPYYVFNKDFKLNNKLKNLI